MVGSEIVVLVGCYAVTLKLLMFCQYMDYIMEILMLFLDGVHIQRKSSLIDKNCV